MQQWFKIKVRCLGWQKISIAEKNASLSEMKIVL